MPLIRYHVLNAWHLVKEDPVGKLELWLQMNLPNDARDLDSNVLDSDLYVCSGLENVGPIQLESSVNTLCRTYWITHY